MIDWLALPSDPGPAPWVRPWQWLRMVRELKDEQGLQAYLAEAERHGAPAKVGITPWFGRSRQLPVPRDLVIEEWLGQSILFRAHGQWMRLTTGRSAVPAGRHRPVAFASCSLPPGGSRARETPLSPPLGALDANARWTDQVWFGSLGECADYARGTRQPFVLLWQEGELQVWDVAARDVVAAAPARLTRAVRACPLIRDGVPGQLCRMYGGPWVAASRVAAGKWLRERWGRLRDVGCDTCGDGEVRLGPGDPAPIHDRYELGSSGEGSWLDRARYGPAPCRYSDIVREPL